MFYPQVPGRFFHNRISESRFFRSFGAVSGEIRGSPAFAMAPITRN
jgi:hypothetical protein